MGLRARRRLLSSERPPKSCHDLKNQIEAFARHGIALKGVDFDTMLAGFLINSGQGEPSLTRSLSRVPCAAGREQSAGHECGPGQKSSRSAGGASGSRRAHFDVQRDRDADRADTGRDGSRRNRHRRRRAQSHLEGICRADEPARARVLRAGGPRVQSQLADPVARGAVYSSEAVGQGAEKNQEWIFDRRRYAREARGGASDAAQADRVPHDFEIEIHLCRRAVRGDSIGHRPNPHDLASGAGAHRTRQLERSESAEYPDPQRRGPPDSPRLRAEAGMRLRVGRLFANRSARDGSSVGRQDSRRGVQRPARTSTSAPRPRCWESRRTRSTPRRGGWPR